MFEVSIGNLRLDVWEDDRGVVSRSAKGGKALKVPLDAPAREAVRGMRRMSIGSLVASIFACAGGARLLRNGDYVYAVGVCLVAVILAALAGIWLLGWHMPRRRGQFVVLDRAAIRQFRTAAEAEQQVLGREPADVDRDGAIERLWRLACELSEAKQPNDPAPTSAPPETAP